MVIDQRIYFDFILNLKKRFLKKNMFFGFFFKNEEIFDFCTIVEISNFKDSENLEFQSNLNSKYS